MILPRLTRSALPFCLRVILLNVAFLVSDELLLTATVNAHNSIPLLVADIVVPVEAILIVVAITE